MEYLLIQVLIDRKAVIEPVVTVDELGHVGGKPVDRERLVGLMVLYCPLNTLATVLQDPQIRAGADALFSTIIRGAAGAAEFIAKIAGGLSSLFTGKGNNARVNLELQIEDLREQMADALEELEDMDGALGDLARHQMTIGFDDHGKTPDW